MADKKKDGKGEKKKELSKRSLYKVEGNKVVRARRACPKCGPGVFLAEHKNRASCGRCGYTEKKAVTEGAPQHGGGGKPKGKGPKPAPPAQAPAPTPAPA